MIRKCLAVGLTAAMAVAAFGRDTPIYNGKLTSDLNGNGFAITNFVVMPPTATNHVATKAYVDGKALDTNAVISIALPNVTNAIENLSLTKYHRYYNGTNSIQWIDIDGVGLPGLYLNGDLHVDSWDDDDGNYHSSTIEIETPTNIYISAEGKSIEEYFHRKIDIDGIVSVVSNRSLAAIAGNGIVITNSLPKTISYALQDSAQLMPIVYIPKLLEVDERSDVYTDVDCKNLDSTIDYVECLQETYGPRYFFIDNEENLIPAMRMDEFDGKVYSKVISATGDAGLSASAVTNIAASSAVTNAGAVAYADGKFTKEVIIFDSVFGEPTTNWVGDMTACFGYPCVGIYNETQGYGIQLFDGDSESTKVYGSLAMMGGWTRLYGDSASSQSLPVYLNSLEWRTSGDHSLADYGITNEFPVIAAADPTFSNAVMNVGIGLTADERTQINAILADIGETPLGEATTIGGLLAALAAAVAWLKKKKIAKLTCSGVSDITTNDGTANVSSLFTSANTSLMATINGAFDNGETTNYPQS